MNVSGHLLQNHLCGMWVVAINTELSLEHGLCVKATLFSEKNTGIRRTA